ncbi:hypothetical protein [uncultured Agrobacterium sp.]|uniref:hypothetical protein n=1 Tax=uncultured Agrobacterium sp. TaxID=157277 RepID=UPI0025E9B1E5|nr:hypothetical protein [uncultured Agrobacterium sp.]
MTSRISLGAVLAFAVVAASTSAYGQQALTQEQQEVVESCKATCDVEVVAAAIAEAGSLGPAMITRIIPNLPVNLAVSLVSAAVKSAPPTIATQIAKSAVSAAEPSVKNSLATAAVAAVPAEQKQAMGAATAEAGAQTQTGDIQNNPGSPA